MTIKATVRVRPRKPVEPTMLRPDPEDLQEAARLLSACGFQVRRVGRFGVSVEADADVFLRTLGVDLRLASDRVKVPRPASPDLDRLIDLVESSPDPEIFQG